jgi:hypothetical protein
MGSDLDDSRKTVESPANLRVVRRCCSGALNSYPVCQFVTAVGPMGKLTTRREVMPLLPVVFGLGELEAAAAIGISASKFRVLVNEKRMPSPRRLDSRKIWDVDELRAAFKALPYDKETEEPDSWADLA